MTEGRSVSSTVEVAPWPIPDPNPTGTREPVRDRDQGDEVPEP